MSRQFLFLIAAGFMLIFAVGAVAVLSINNLNQPASQVASGPAVASSTGAVSGPPAAAQLPPPAPVLTPGISTPKTVQRFDIDQLAAAVNLGKTPPAAKDVWARETPIARQLVKSMCDCDQRNWLKHFIETGEEAASGSPKFGESLKLLATLRRGNDDLVSRIAH